MSRQLIALTQGQVAIVDDDKYMDLSQNKWCAAWCPHTQSYRAERAQTVNGKNRLILMHRQIIQAPDGVQVDHWNGDTLDNRLENLRLATRTQNCRNARIRKDNTSGYKGVTFNKRSGKWRFQIQIGGGKRLWGYRGTALDASEEYNRLAALYHGQFARSR